MRFAIDVAETASVGLSTAPRAIALAEGDRARQVEVGEDHEQDPPDRDRRDDHERHPEEGDRWQIAAEVDHREGDRGAVEQRRQHDQQDPLGLEVDRRRPGDVAEPRADRDEQQRGGDADAARDAGRRDEHQHRGSGQQDELGLHTHHRRSPMRPLCLRRYRARGVVLAGGFQNGLCTLVA
jgi:hypothetical protein